jgi:hypothetical protein
MDKRVIEQDARLEKQAEKSREELAAHRWHWTLDETNPKRVPIREYARSVGRGESTIRSMVNAYAEWSAPGARRTGDLADYIARARIGADTIVAAEAVAEARGVSLDTARRHHADEVKSVKATAEERALRNKTTPEQEVARVAQNREGLRRVEARNKEVRRGSHTVRYIQAEGDIAQAMRRLRKVLDDTEGVEFSSEERDLVAGALAQLRAVLNLLDMRIVGTTDIDWDAEMAKLSGDAS